MEEMVDKLLHKLHEDEFIKTKRRHINKLITKKKKEENEHPKIADNWICNLSKHQLTDTERSVLSQGLNFAITPKNIPLKDFILATELSCEKIPDDGQKAALRNETAGILKLAKLPPSNITPSESKAINSLSKNKNITIIPSDKGRTTVIMDTESYENQMKEMLEDIDT